MVRLLARATVTSFALVRENRLKLNLGRLLDDHLDRRFFHFGLEFIDEIV